MVGQFDNKPDIAEMWKNRFSSLLNSVTNCQNKKYVCNSFENCHDVDKYLCTVDLINKVLQKLPLSRAAGQDGLFAEHLIYSHSTLSILLSMLFNACLIHGRLPNKCLTTIIVPISKNALGNLRDPNNYRPITLATVLSKMFEHVILEKILHLVQTTDNQFGFKSKHSTDMCVFLLKQCINYYNQCGSPVYTVFLDSSKAYDRVNHFT